jgi:hypothetical protein
LSSVGCDDASRAKAVLTAALPAAVAAGLAGDQLSRLTGALASCDVAGAGAGAVPLAGGRQAPYAVGPAASTLAAEGGSALPADVLVLREREWARKELKRLQAVGERVSHEVR